MELKKKEEAGGRRERKRRSTVVRLSHPSATNVRLGMDWVATGNQTCERPESEEGPNEQAWLVGDG